MPERWLITGGCGFLGTALIKRLIKENVPYIRVLDNLTVGGKDDLAKVCDFTEIKDFSLLALNYPQKEDSLNLLATTVELIIGDIRDNNITDKAAKDIDIIVHFAANTGVPISVEDPRTDMECNVVGIFNMLESARKQEVNRFVFASSGAPAGEVEPPIHEELPPHPVSPYGASKLAGEGYCSSYFKTFGIDTVVLRFGNVYGPGSQHKNSAVAKFIRHGINGEKVEIYGDGTQTRDFIYIDDLVDAVIKSSVINNIGGEIFQIATAHETTINELIDMLKRTLENNGIKLDVDYKKKRLGDVMRNYSDTSKVEQKLSWRAKTNLLEGVEATVLWFINLSLKNKNIHKIEVSD